MSSRRNKRTREDFQLVKAALPVKTKNGGKKKGNSSKAKGAKKTPKSAPLTLQLPNPNSPTFVQDSMRSISNLRNLCKNCLKYIQKADSILDTLFSSANSLHETGLLQKLMQSKGKNLSTGDWTTILLTLMNTPLGSSLLKKPDGDER
ncbi:hypothetical protein DNHGIG_13370 [Collibacillus ludicampi]|jgi:hypothetical protein|uniref:Uncharacterized protein n=1 Tax=Collibacillus ludicampi TaxID=2771369 RepID=A0AAV4LDE3_9BACL|nr:hypothetical protein [Collibacillus ludicampi]GIM45788.1 hypothetical protein DNHGIG_13370 [Collibacillus ludicampi]